MTTFTSIQPTEDNAFQDVAEWRVVFRLSSICLQYPDAAWVYSGEVVDGFDLLTNQDLRRSFQEFFDYLQEIGLEEAAQRYVQTFDFSETTNLYLTYSAMKEEKERGQVLIQLKNLYASLGYEMMTEDLSDYLPVFLEFLSVAPIGLINQVMPQYQKGILALSESLQRMESPYANLIQACVRMMNWVASEGGAQ